MDQLSQRNLTFNCYYLFLLSLVLLWYLLISRGFGETFVRGSVETFYGGLLAGLLLTHRLRWSALCLALHTCLKLTNLLFTDKYYRKEWQSKCLNMKKLSDEVKAQFSSMCVWLGPRLWCLSSHFVSKLPISDDPTISDPSVSDDTLARQMACIQQHCVTTLSEDESHRQKKCRRTCCCYWLVRLVWLTGQGREGLTI